MSDIKAFFYYIIILVGGALVLTWELRVEKLKERTRKNILIVIGIIQLILVLIVLIITLWGGLALFLEACIIGIIAGARYDYSKYKDPNYKYPIIQFQVCLINIITALYIIFEFSHLLSSTVSMI